MQEAVRLCAAFAGSVLLALTLVPLAIRVAARTGFLDRPAGYKAHGVATPYLGGLAVLCAFLPAAVLLGAATAHLAPIVICAVAVCLLGTADDRRPISPGWRVALEVGVALVLWNYGLGWALFDSDAANLVLTVLWVVALINAVNLMDNMDGAAASVALAAALGLALLAVVESQVALAAVLMALAGSCAGFLRFNLAAPRGRIFLGDGGSMLLGFLLAAATMALPTFGGLGWPGLGIALLLVAMPALDTALVIVSRRRRGISVLTGGRDHLTHRLGRRFACRPVVVAAILVAAQLAASLAAVALAGAGRSALIVVTGFGLLALCALIAVLERPAWHADGPAASAARAAVPAEPSEPGGDLERRPASDDAPAASGRRPQAIGAVGSLLLALGVWAWARTRP